MSEELLVRHCSPTLAGIKASSLFSCDYDTPEQLRKDLRQANRVLVPKGLRVLALRCSHGRALIYVFRPKKIAAILENQEAADLLRHLGYEDIRVEPCVCQLMDRFRVEDEFPHEVGLFLGYPPEDVVGFIQNHAKGQKCTGCWKVYGDEAKAKKCFAQYKKCTQVYYDLWEDGRSLERLTVAS